ncbi:YgaP family membrane protein [Bacillus dakarensis]|uniref:YgaP family membrane protein n=1 Tax=Robertmurraya dakarensis TaxID=1926278 RepID=UPI000982034E|nr:DUF2892 domain-containing protein [Bacillus dakarensis]
MNIKPNIGILNSLIRITCGLTMLAWSTAKMVKQPWRDSNLLIAILGAMKVGEGIVRYCPITALFEQVFFQNGSNNKEQQSGFQSSLKDESKEQTDRPVIPEM